MKRFYLVFISLAFLIQLHAIDNLPVYIGQFQDGSITNSQINSILNQYKIEKWEWKADNNNGYFKISDMDVVKWHSIRIYGLKKTNSPITVSLYIKYRNLDTNKLYESTYTCFSVTVMDPVTDIIISADKNEIKIGESIDLYATVKLVYNYDYLETINWTATGNAIELSNKRGEYGRRITATGKASGSSTIRAQYGDHYREIYLKVASEPTKIQLNASHSGGEIPPGTIVYLNTPNVTNASVFYTLDGNNPSSSSSRYTSNGITINKSCTLKAIAYKDGYETSDMLVINYTVSPSQKLILTASPSSGEVSSGTVVKLTASSSGTTVTGADIYYTLNGTTPTNNSKKYTSSGITINSACTLKAIAYKSGYETSSVLTQNYTIKTSNAPNISIVSVTCNNTNLNSLTQNDKLILNATFKNTGAVCQLWTSVRLFDTEKKGKYSGENVRLELPAGGEVSHQYEYSLKDVEPGNYLASVRYYNDWEENDDDKGWYYNPNRLISISVIKAIVDGYISLGFGTFCDNFFEKQTEVEILQSQETPEFFRIMRPYDGITNAVKGVNYQGGEYLNMYVLGPGWSFGGTPISTKGLVFYDDTNTGYVDSSYNDSILIAHPSGFIGFEEEAFWQYNKVLEYQTNGLPAVVQLAPIYYLPNYGGGWNNSQYDDVIVIRFPDVPSGIESPLTKATDVSESVYSLSGQRLSVPRKGINIINGRKVLVK